MYTKVYSGKKRRRVIPVLTTDEKIINLHKQLGNDRKTAIQQLRFIEFKSRMKFI